MAKNVFEAPQNLAPSMKAALKAGPGPAPQYVTPDGRITSQAQTGWITNTPMPGTITDGSSLRQREIEQGRNAPQPQQSAPQQTSGGGGGAGGGSGSGSPNFNTLQMPNLPPLPTGTLTLPSMAGGTLTLPQMPQGGLPARPAMFNGFGMNNAGATPAPAPAPAAAPAAPAPAAAPAAAPSGISQFFNSNGQIDRAAIMNAIQARLAENRAQAQTPEGRQATMASAANMISNASKPVEAVAPVQMPYPKVGMLG